MGDGFTLTLASDLAEISRLTERLARFGRDHDLPERAIQHMTLALDELITIYCPSDDHDSPLTVSRRGSFCHSPFSKLKIEMFSAEP